MTDGPLYVVVEFAENGCLLEYVRENRTSVGESLEAVSSLNNQEKIRLALDVAQGMQHLAKHKVSIAIPMSDLPALKEYVIIYRLV
jgi:serine/threonine protein kinase